jgi:hypothetical protein
MSLVVEGWVDVDELVQEEKLVSATMGDCGGRGDSRRGADGRHWASHSPFGCAICRYSNRAGFASLKF